MLLVDDDGAELRHGHEDRRAGTEDDARATAESLAPGFEPLGIGERRMQYRDGCGEALAETRDELRREADLRHQHQHRSILREEALREAQIHLGLAASGHPFQK